MSLSNEPPHRTRLNGRCPLEDYRIEKPAAQAKSVRLLGVTDPADDAWIKVGEGDPPGVHGRMFRFWARNIKMDAVTIENVSKQTIKIGSLLEDRSSDTRLISASERLPEPSRTLRMCLGGEKSRR